MDETVLAFDDDNPHPGPGWDPRSGGLLEVTVTRATWTNVGGIGTDFYM